MRLEAPQDLEARREDPHNAILTAQEETIRSRAHAADFVVVEKGLALVVWRFDLGYFEEVKCFPLANISFGCSWWCKLQLNKPRSAPFDSCEGE